MNKSNNKYGSKGVYWDANNRRILESNEVAWLRFGGKKKGMNNIIFFASKFEFTVYKTLTQMFGVYAVVVQHPVPLLPAGICCPQGKKWLVDFAIKADPRINRPLILVEAKGYPTETFLANLSCLEVVNPTAFQNLSLVFDRSIPKRRVLQNLREARNSFGHRKALLLDEFVELYSPLITA